MKATIRTHVGHRREVNEDCAEVFHKDEQIMLAVIADGMGGHNAGDIASQMAVNVLKEAFLHTESPADVPGWENWLQSVIQTANQKIYEYGSKKEAYNGMGTTIVAVLFLPENYVVAHVGDSRLYRYTGSEVELMTADHSLVQELVECGQITKEEAETHPQRNVITRALGTDPTTEIDVKSIDYMDEPSFILCTDGLSGVVSEQQMTDHLSEMNAIEEQATNLMDLALNSSGEDNITFLLVHIDSSNESAQKLGENE